MLNVIQGGLYTPDKGRRLHFLSIPGQTCKHFPADGTNAIGHPKTCLPRQVADLLDLQPVPLLGNPVTNTATHARLLCPLLRTLNLNGLSRRLLANQPAQQSQPPLLLGFDLQVHEALQTGRIATVFHAGGHLRLAHPAEYVQPALLGDLAADEIEQRLPDDPVGGQLLALVTDGKNIPRP